ncbi:Chibby family [Phytophthora infestans]|uniref:Chibby family n=1 Tax=Phytophthora infestans TaxID=4787 RepID=A0A8S9U9X0_PHYIN|nr:Chibby family [Phytophthora infestans]
MASPTAATATRTRTPRPSEEELKAVDREIPIRLTLGAATLSLGASGQWELDHTMLQQTKERVQILEERTAALEAENAQLRDKCTRMTEESNMEKFKCQLLVEMLAVSSLDEEREKARAASIKTDVVALLEQARAEGLDVRKLSAALTAGPLAP